MGMKWKKRGNKFVAELLLACFLAVSFAVPQTGVPIEATWVREVSEGEDPGKEPGSGETDDGRSGRCAIYNAIYIWRIWKNRT